MAGFHTDGTITAFEPRPTCYTPSNLWLTTMPCGEEWSPDDTSAFRADTTHAPNPPMCTVTVLGPSDFEDEDCYRPRDGSSDLERLNDCPVGMTSALEITSEVGEMGIKEIATYCCPSAYEFATSFDKLSPTGEDWFSTFLCRANTVKTLSDQTVTLTVSTSPLITTEAAWDYERDFIYAYPDGFIRYVYEGAGTTSECFGYEWCQINSNPLTAATPAPTTAAPATATASATPSSTAEAGQDGQEEATQSAQGESGASSNVKDVLLGKPQGMVAFLMAVCLILS